MTPTPLSAHDLPGAARWMEHRSAATFLNDARTFRFRATREQFFPRPSSGVGLANVDRTFAVEDINEQTFQQLRQLVRVGHGPCLGFCARHCRLHPIGN